MKMNNYNFRYTRKESIGRFVANLAVFAGGAGAMWLTLIVVDRLMNCLGM